MSVTETTRPARVRRSPRRLRSAATIGAVLALLFGLPWYTLVAAGTRWPAWVVVIGSMIFIAAVVMFPVLMFRGHARGRDGAARAGDTILGVIWVLFAWSVLGNVLRIGLAAGGVADPVRSRLVAAVVAAVSLVLVCWGYVKRCGCRASGGWRW